MLKPIVNVALTTIYKVQRLSKPCRFVFLVGHMRSGSTLLTRILSDNPMVTGYGETFLHYESARDLDTLVRIVSAANRRVLLRPYIMDKVIHNDVLFDPVLQHENCRFVFLLREPEPSMQSHFRNMIRWNKYPDMRPDDRQSLVHDYYDSRLRVIEHEALRINEPLRRAFVTHDQLINRTDEVFRMLEDFLGLDVPLSENYSPTKNYGIGDASEFIMKGYIDRTIQHEPMPIPPWILEKASELYERVTARMGLLCRSLQPTSAVESFGTVPVSDTEKSSA